MRHIALAIALVLVVSGSIPAQERPTGFLDRVIQVEGTTHRYQVYVPSSYEPGTRWPVILSLHGAGERGTDGLIQTEVGLGSAIRRFPSRYPAIVVFPQAPTDTAWTGLPGRVAMAALDRTMKEFSTDPARVYLTGLSMGGNGAWSLAYAHPERFAAAVVICGFIAGGTRFPSFLPADTADPAALLASRVSKLPIWVYHGDADNVVPVAGAREIVERLRQTGSTVKYTELPGVGHNSWDAAYRSAEVAAWLFAQRK